MIFLKPIQNTKHVETLLKSLLKNFFVLVQRKIAINLAYQVIEDDRTKNSTANAIIISHGLMGQSTNWKSISKCLLKGLDPPRKIYIIDNRNHGNSPHTSDHNYELMVEDTIQFYSSLDLKEAVLLGHSMGGRAFMHMALKNPEKVSSLILVDISPIIREDEFVLLSEPLRLLKILSAIDLSQLNGDLYDVKKIIDNELKKRSIEHTAVRQFLLQNLIKNSDNSFSWKLNIPVLIHSYSNFASVNFQNLVYNKSVLLVAGEKSPFVPKSQEQSIKKIFSNVRLEFIPNAGHLVHMEYSQLFCELVIDFLRNEK